MLPNDRRVMRAAETETATTRFFVASARPIAKRKVDYLTLGVALAIYGGFFALTWFFNSLPLWLAAPLGSLLLAWYGSFQHETIHGHPTASRPVNRLLGGLPLSLWIPYPIYRETHLRHHRHEGRYLTEVDRDPESFYLRPGTLAAAGLVRRWIHEANCTLAGRVVIGPAVAVGTFWLREARGQRHAVIWALHVLWVAIVLTWVVAVCHIPLAVYAGLVVYPSVSLGLLRSFAEHRADASPRRRTRVVESNLLWSLIFLNNNLHIAHHAHPRLPWHELPRVWRRMQRGIREPGLVIRGGYLELLRNYLFRPVVSAEHPGPNGRD